jgi:hypothetical protein
MWSDESSPIISARGYLWTRSAVELPDRNRDRRSARPGGLRHERGGRKPVAAARFRILDIAARSSLPRRHPCRNRTIFGGGGFLRAEVPEKANKFIQCDKITTNLLASVFLPTEHTKRSRFKVLRAKDRRTRRKGRHDVNFDLTAPKNHEIWESPMRVTKE